MEEKTNGRVAVDMPVKILNAVKRLRVETICSLLDLDRFSMNNHRVYKFTKIFLKINYAYSYNIKSNTQHYRLQIYVNTLTEQQLPFVANMFMVCV